MTTRKQIGANRCNARSSTGPKTAAGKAASAANALRHGLSAAHTFMLPDEDPEEFERLQEHTIADLKPENTLQAVLAQRIVVLLWRLDRAARLEAELFVHGELVAHRGTLRAAARRGTLRAVFARARTREDGDGEDGDGEGKGTHAKPMDTLYRATDAIDDEILRHAPMAKVLVEREASARAFDRLGRYEATLQRALHRTLEEYRQLRREAAADSEATASAAAASAAGSAACDRGSMETPCAADAPAPAADTLAADTPATDIPEADTPEADTPAADTPAAWADDAARHADEEGFLQNEANYAQRIDRARSSPPGAILPEAPPVF